MNVRANFSIVCVYSLSLLSYALAYHVIDIQYLPPFGTEPVINLCSILFVFSLFERDLCLKP